MKRITPVLFIILCTILYWSCKKAPESNPAVIPPGGKVDSTSGTFSGYTFNIYNKSNSKIPFAFINNIIVDKKNLIWISNPDSGIASFNGVNWTVYSSTNSPLGVYGSYFYSFAADKNNTIWVATQNDLYSFANNKWTTYSAANAPPLINNNISAMCVDSMNNVWLGFQNFYPDTAKSVHFLAKFDGTKWTTYSDINMNQAYITTLSPDKYNKIWIGTEGSIPFVGGLYIFSGNKVDSIFNGEGNYYSYNITDINADASGNMWTTAGIGQPYVLGSTPWCQAYNDMTTQETTSTSLPNPYSFNGPYCIAFANNVIWAGGNAYLNEYETGKGGLAFYKNNLWQIVGPSNSSLPLISVGCIAVDKQKNIWAATSRGLMEIH